VALLLWLELGAELSCGPRQAVLLVEMWHKVCVLSDTCLITTTCMQACSFSGNDCNCVWQHERFPKLWADARSSASGGCFSKFYKLLLWFFGTSALTSTPKALTITLSITLVPFSSCCLCICCDAWCQYKAEIKCTRPRGSGRRGASPPPPLRHQTT
jgi:hypothetical protein